VGLEEFRAVLPQLFIRGHMETESQNLVDTVTMALRDARKRGKKGKVMVAITCLAPQGVEAISWSKMFLKILDGNGATASMLEDILENQSVRSLDYALRVLRRPED
jgi:hypothetical protein